MLVQDALRAVLRDPMLALTAIFEPGADACAGEHPADTAALSPDLDGPGPLPPAIARFVLSHRHFRMLTPHTILKSFHQPDAFAGDATHAHMDMSSLPGISDLRRVGALPIWLVSNPSVQVCIVCELLGSCSLMRHKGSPGLSAHRRRPCRRRQLPLQIMESPLWWLASHLRVY